MPRFMVIVLQDMDADGADASERVEVTAAHEVAAAAEAMRVLCLGYADAVDVSPPDAVSIELDLHTGGIKGTSFLYCSCGAGGFSYDGRW
jgi:hypothetical protein